MRPPFFVFSCKKKVNAVALKDGPFSYSKLEIRPIINFFLWRFWIGLVPTLILIFLRDQSGHFLIPGPVMFLTEEDKTVVMRVLLSQMPKGISDFRDGRDGPFLVCLGAFEPIQPGVGASYIDKLLPMSSMNEER